MMSAMLKDPEFQANEVLERVGAREDGARILKEVVLAMVAEYWKEQAEELAAAAGESEDDGDD